MTIRIPSSLKWLITKYQHKQRELLETEKLLFELSVKRPKLIESIESLGRVIDLHDIPISASELPKLGKNTKLTGLPYGKIAKFIYEYLGQLPKGEEATLSEILLYCLQRSDWQDFSDESIRRFSRSVRKRLNGMVDNGSITRTVLGENNKEPRYKSLKA